MSDSVLSTIIGASIALIGLIVAKEGKTSEFRQQWIDGLRADIAEYVSYALQLPVGNLDTQAANECLARIRLRLNPTEKLSKELLGIVLNLTDTVGEGTASTVANMAADKVVSASQAVLKEEWKRVKRGEWKYILVLSTAVASLIISAAILFYPEIQRVIECVCHISFACPHL